MSAVRPKWAPKRLMDLIGQTVLTRNDMQNAYVSLPAGSSVTVESATAWHKINVKGAKCDCCGVSPIMARVHINDLAPA